MFFRFVAGSSPELVLTATATAADWLASLGAGLQTPVSTPPLIRAAILFRVSAGSHLWSDKGLGIFCIIYLRLYTMYRYRYMPAKWQLTSWLVTLLALVTLLLLLLLHHLVHLHLL